jgi:hypothetical protein
VAKAEAILEYSGSMCEVFKEEREKRSRHLLYIQQAGVVPDRWKINICCAEFSFYSAWNLGK